VSAFFFGVPSILSSYTIKSIIFNSNSIVRKSLEVFLNLAQRKTQTPQYWQEKFKVSDQDIEAIYHQFLERGRPIALDDIALFIIKRHCDAEELEARSELQQGDLYQPKQSYQVDQKLVFAPFNFAVGTVVSTRQGRHPEHGPFTVIGVDFGDNSPVREFVTDFKQDHPLNAAPEQSLASLQGLMPPEEIYTTYQDSIRPKIKSALTNNPDFVEFHGNYFLRDLLPEFHEGLFNIADAAIDINNGPLSIDALIEQMGLVEEGQEINDVMRFSISYRLANDERFNDVGPSGQVLWYLQRMAPPEVQHQPRRLQAGEQVYNPDLFDEDLRQLLSEIDDELTRPEDIKAPETNQITVVLNYPHQRVGTLPLTPKTQPFFPMSYYNPVLFEFVDGRTGNTFPGWTILEHKYVFGLEKWYKKNKLPVGAYVIIKPTRNPMQVVVDYESTRTQRDWVRMANVVGYKLAFQMSQAAIGSKYDELMIFGEASTSNIDSLWINAEERNISIYNLMCDIFPELSKLNPQSTVHAKTLYSAVNVVRRASPGVIFQHLSTHRCFIPMNHGYWVYDASLRE
jgi:hypothetical protein